MAEDQVVHRQRPRDAAETVGLLIGALGEQSPLVEGDPGGGAHHQGDALPLIEALP